MNDKILGFNHLRKKAMESSDKIAFAVDVFHNLHDDAPPEDFEGLGGRLAGIIKQANGDYLRVLQVMWVAAAMGIQGSHLGYIQGMLRNGTQTRGKGQKEEPPPTKYRKVDPNNEP